MLHRVEFSHFPSPAVVERFVIEMFSTRASTSGLPSRSVRRKMNPLLAGAGTIAMFTGCRCAGLCLKSWRRD